MHAGSDLLKLGQVLQGHIKKFGLGNVSPKIDNGKRTFPVQGKVNCLPIAEQDKRMAAAGIRHKPGGS